MSLELTVVESSRKKEAFTSSVVRWKYKITTGSRCSGLLSNKEYKTYDSAYTAGKRMKDKLESI